MLKTDMLTKINVVKAEDLVLEEGDTCLVIPSYYDEFPLESSVLSEEDEITLQALVDREIITGKLKSYYYLPTPGKHYQGVLVMGLGRRSECDAEALRRCAGTVVAPLKRNRVRHVYFDASRFEELAPEVFVEGLNLGQYHFDTYKKSDNSPVTVSEITVVTSDGADREQVGLACQRSALISLAANGARHFANTAANDMTPTTLAHAALEIADMENSGCSCTVCPSSAVAYTVKPRFFSSSSSAARSSVSVTGTRNTDPIDARTALGEYKSAHPDSTARLKLNASALRIIAPTLVGSDTPSSTSTLSASPRGSLLLSTTAATPCGVFWSDTLSITKSGALITSQLIHENSWIYRSVASICVTAPGTQATASRTSFSPQAKKSPVSSRRFF